MKPSQVSPLLLREFVLHSQTVQVPDTWIANGFVRLQTVANVLGQKVPRCARGEGLVTLLFGESPHFRLPLSTQIDLSPNQRRVITDRILNFILEAAAEQNLGLAQDQRGEDAYDIRLSPQLPFLCTCRTHGDLAAAYLHAEREKATARRDDPAIDRINLHLKLLEAEQISEGEPCVRCTWRKETYGFPEFQLQQPMVMLFRPPVLKEILHLA